MENTEKTFAQLGLSEHLLNKIALAGFSTPTEVQTKSVGHILAGKDLMASAQTGSGKTAAYAWPIIDALKRAAKKRPARALIMVPTRELAVQVKEQFERFGKHLRIVAIYGGTGYLRQYRQFERGVDIIVATPGRIFDLAEQRKADLSSIEILVLDEADRLMDMGFMPQIRQVVEHIPADRQTLMFSATIDKRIEELAGEYLKVPVIIRSSAEQIDPTSIEQSVHLVPEMAKENFICDLLQKLEGGSVLVFTRTRQKASDVSERLRAANIPAEKIHGDISQRRREKVMAKFRNGEFSVLVATDIAARGLDIPNISHVINYDLPNCPEDYVHRIGRTGRAGRNGIACSLVSKDQRYLLRGIEAVLGRKLDIQTADGNAGNHTKPVSRPLKPRKRNSSARHTSHYRPIPSLEDLAPTLKISLASISKS